MTRHMTLMAGCAILAMSASAAYADCAADLAAFGGGQTQTAGAEGEVSKDGSLAPLQTEGSGGDASAPTTAGGGTTISEGGETTTAPAGATAEANAESGAAETDVASDGGGNATGAVATGTEAGGAQEESAMGQGAQGGEAIAKDGTVAPLESAHQEGHGESTAGQAGVAMSQQDAQAQQQGGGSAQDQAAAEAGAHGSGDVGGHSAGQMEALERAHAALAAGDEAGCAAALEEARSM